MKQKWQLKLGRFDKCISVLQSGNEVLMLSLSCFSFPVFYLGEFFNSDFSFKFFLSTSWTISPNRMSHCLRECQAQVPIQVLIEHLFYSSSSYINVYFFLYCWCFHLFQVSLLKMMTILCCSLSFALCYVKLIFYFARQKEDAFLICDGFMLFSWFNFLHTAR